MTPADATETPTELPWDHDVMTEQAERKWAETMRDLEADWRL